MNILKVWNLDHRIFLNILIASLNLAVVITIFTIKSLQFNTLIDLILLVLTSIFVVLAFTMKRLNTKTFNLIIICFLLPAVIGLTGQIILN